MRPILLGFDVSDEDLEELFLNDGLVEDIKEVRDGHVQRMAAPGRFIVYRDEEQQKLVVLLAVPSQQLN